MEELKQFLEENKELFNWSGLERKYGMSDQSIKNFMQQGYLSKKNKSLLISGLEKSCKNISNICKLNLV